MGRLPASDPKLWPEAWRPSHCASRNRTGFVPLRDAANLPPPTPATERPTGFCVAIHRGKHPIEKLRPAG